MGMRGILRTVSDSQVGFWCPGCEEIHVIRIPPHAHAWGFNGDYDKPTFTPSVLVTSHKKLTDEQYEAWRRGEALPPRVNTTCHSSVTDGVIQFLGDCTHPLAGQSVPLTALPEDAL